MGQTQAARSAPIGQPWGVEDSLELYNVPAWGSGYFSINAAGHVVVRPDTTAGARNRSVRGRAGTAGARPFGSGRDPLLRHPGASPAAPARGLQPGDRRERLPQPLHGGLPDQGQPAAPGGRRGVPLRQGVRLWPRGRLQARAAGGHGDDRDGSESGRSSATASRIRATSRR